MAEVFPPNVKAKASAVTSSCCWATSFVLTKLFPILSEAFGTYFVFWAFAVFSILAFFFVLVLLPDTRGMSMPEIHESLNNSRLDYTETPIPSVKVPSSSSASRSPSVAVVTGS